MIKSFEEDKELKALIRSMSIEKPGKNFSGKVMNKIFELESALERIKSERILGKGFWLILSLFVVIMGTIVVVSLNGVTGSESELTNMLPDITAGERYETVFNKVTGLPLSIAGILLASSFLVFIDRFLSTRSNIGK